MDEETREKQTIILGLTHTNSHFQPSDWAERLGGILSTLRNRRVVYSPLLQPALHDGVKCLLVAEELKSTYPEVYDEVMNFACKNNLQVINEPLAAQPEH